MTFNELTPEHISQIRHVHADSQRPWDSRMRILMEYTGKSERTVRRWIKKLELSNPPKKSEVEVVAAKRAVKDKKYYLITWAQNATPIHPELWKNINIYAKFLDADIHVILGRYKNPTSLFADKEHDWWATEVIPYADLNRHYLHKHVTLLSDVKIQPTATNPLTGLTGITGDSTCIVGHPKMHLEPVSVLEHQHNKYLLTTGACTVPNYTDSKAGAKGKFHHCLGFTIVEIEDDETYYIRQVVADEDGSFNDLYFSVDEDIKPVSNLSGLRMGDIHQIHLDPDVFNQTRELINDLEPDYTVVDDVLDAYSISHHHSKDPLLRFFKHKKGADSIKWEIDSLMDWLHEMVLLPTKVVVVRSNHDEHLDRWIMDTDWRKDVVNAAEYTEYLSILLSGKADKGLVPYLIHREFGDDIITLGRQESFKIEDIENGVHGDIGSNGSRGSIEQFRKLSTKMIVDHYHAPFRKDGVLSAGASCKLRLGYNEGPSNWRHAHIIIHPNGKSQHILFNGSNFSTLRARYVKISGKS